jgi:MFS transporter, DHA1 family, tetracycline resistance protein
VKDAAGGAAAAPRQSAVFVFVTVALDAMGIGIIMPVMPDLLQELTGLSIGRAAVWGGYLTFTYAAMQFLMSPVLGGLSDRFGRRPVLLVSLAMLGVDYLVMAVAPSLWLLFLGRAGAGIAGATYATATAYIADVTPREKRAAAFGLVGAGFGVGFVLGPAFGGLVGELGTRAPFYAAAALSLANLGYGWLVLPESLPPERRRAFSWRRANRWAGWSRSPASRWWAGSSRPRSSTRSRTMSIHRSGASTPRRRSPGRMPRSASRSPRSASALRSSRAG